VQPANFFFTIEVRAGRLVWRRRAIRGVLNDATVSWHSRYSLRYQNYQ